MNLKEFLIHYKKLSETRQPLITDENQTESIYCLALIRKDKLRDHYIENILQMSDDNQVLSFKDIDYILISNNQSGVIKRASSYKSVISSNVNSSFRKNKAFGDPLLHKAVLICQKWKTIAGAKKACNNFLASKIYYSISPYDAKFSKENFVPVICDIGAIYQHLLKLQIVDLNKSHQKKLERLYNKYKKYFK